MFFQRSKVHEVQGVVPTAFVGGAARRYGEVHAQVYINLSPRALAGYPLGIFVIWQPLSTGSPDAFGVQRLLDTVDPLAAHVSSYWFDDGCGVASLALASWLVNRRGWTTEAALAALSPKSRLLTASTRELWCLTQD